MVPDEEDLIGFITTGNYNLMAGKGFGIGSVLLSRIVDQTLGFNPSANPAKKLSNLHRHICIVRDAGEAFGRLARWELI
jgi:ribonuclease P/MRP protein subunit POP1